MALLQLPAWVGFPGGCLVMIRRETVPSRTRATIWRPFTQLYLSRSISSAILEPLFTGLSALPLPRGCILTSNSFYFELPSHSRFSLHRVDHLSFSESIHPQCLSLRYRSWSSSWASIAIYIAGPLYNI